MISLWQYLNAARSIEMQGLTEGITERFAELVSRGHSIADLLSHYGDDFGHLTAERLTGLYQARRRYTIWLKRKRALDQARKSAKLPPLPAEIFDHASTPDQLDAVFRTARLCPRSAMGDDASWLAVLKSGVELWQRCLASARKQGTIRCEALDLEHPHATAYEPYLRSSEVIDEIASHRWLAMRRGEREGVLTLTVVLPDEQLLEQAALLQPRLGPTTADRSAESLLDELARSDLPAWIAQILDTEAETEAINAAAASLTGLLRSGPVQSRRLGGVFVSRQGAPAAVVITDREGEVQAHKALRAEGGWTAKVVEFLAEQGVHQAVLPTSAPTAELLTQIDTALANASVQVYKIRPAALAEARLPLTNPPLRLGASVASALVLVRRALDPLKEWSAVDPVNIGIAEYQNDLDQERLRAALRQTVELCRLERRRGKSSYMGTAVPRGGTAMARLNPLVKSLQDLRGGMTVNGVVTNISHFGAFINIGLPQEGLAHISELSDQYVNDPNEVVSIGQQVTAHVLQVDGGRGRISLSLKTHRPAQMMREGRDGPPGAGGRNGRDGSASTPRPTSKAEALASLERLFKK